MTSSPNFPQSNGQVELNNSDS